MYFYFYLETKRGLLLNQSSQPAVCDVTKRFKNGFADFLTKMHNYPATICMLTIWSHPYKY